MAIGMRTTGLAGLLVAAVLVTGCASSTLIESRPAGATVTVDGDRYVGETPLRVRDLPVRGSRRDYHFSKEGYYPRVIQVAPGRNGKHATACFCTAGLLWPLLFFGEYPSDIIIELEREAPAPRAEFRPHPDVSFGTR